MRSAHVDLVSQWRIRAPVDKVWCALADPASWPHWWPSVQAVHRLREGGGDGTDTVRRIHWSTPLRRRVVLEVQVVEAVRHERLRGHTFGETFIGEGLWLLRPGPVFTDVTWVWRVIPRRRWQHGLAPLLAPLLRWNHAGVMRVGEAGLRRWLEDAPASDGPAGAGGPG